MKNRIKNILFVFSVLISVISCVVTINYARNLNSKSTDSSENIKLGDEITLFDSQEVHYNNTESGIKSGNVQGAIDELYACASNYTVYNTRLTAVENSKISLNDVYPVGSIYISVNNVNPSTLFGGTWVAFGTGKTLVGVDTNDTNYDTVEESHGSKVVTLTTSNLPSHNHSFTPSGTISGTAVSSHTYTPAGSVSQPTFTGTAVTSGANSRGHTHSVTAAGSVSSSFTGSAVTSGANSRGHTHSVTAAGSVSSTFTGTANQTTSGSGAHTHTVAWTDVNNNHTGNWSDSSNWRIGLVWSSNFGGTVSDAVRGIQNGGAHQHTFTAAGTVSSSFTGSAVTSGGESQNHTHSVTAAGTVSSSFTGSAVTSGGESQNHTHSVTAAGTVSKPTFTGTQATLSHTVTQGTFTGTAGNTGNTGSGTAFSTVDPYITVYMWKRTA